MASIMDKIIVGTTKNVDSVNRRMQVIGRKAEINTRLEEISREREILAKNLGELVYNLQKSGEIHIEKSVPICNEIKGCDNELEQLKQELEQIIEQERQQSSSSYSNMGEIRCQRCGKILSATAKFCGFCGSPVMNQQTPQQQSYGQQQGYEMPQGQGQQQNYWQQPRNGQNANANAVQNAVDAKVQEVKDNATTYTLPNVEQTQAKSDSDETITDTHTLTDVTDTDEKQRDIENKTSESRADLDIAVQKEAVSQQQQEEARVFTWRPVEEESN